MECFTADYIYSPDALLTGHCLEVDMQGTIHALRPLKPDEQAQHYEGIICPGFINAHCHLELSALRGMIPEGKGMTGFAMEVITQRNGIAPEVMQQAIFDGLRELYFTGTVAVGDICNTAISVAHKREFPLLHTHSFIELLGVIGSRAEAILEEGKKLQEAFSDLSHSLTLHAPYSVSPQLKERVYAEQSESYSLHLLESREERMLFEQGEGPFLTFYQQLGLPVPTFPLDHPADYILTDLPSEQSLLLVHMTEVTEAEVQRLLQQFPEAYICICPRSNQYLHNRLPDIPMLMRHTDRICLGTDSLASNHDLRMLEELKFVQFHFAKISLHEQLNWLCEKGAAALRLSHKFGKFVEGKKCGINLIEHIDKSGPRLTPASVVRKLF